MVNLNQVLKYYRGLKGISYDELSKITGVPKTTLYRYENNSHQKIDIKVFCDIANALDVPSGIMDDMLRNNDCKKDNNSFKIPVYRGDGTTNLNDADIIGYEYADIDEEKENYIYISVSGNGMSPYIDDGDLILVKKQNFADDGQIAVLFLDGGELMIKKVVFEGDFVRFISFNPYYPEVMLKISELNRVTFVGKVIESRKKW